ncbi:DNA-protecting protein DprA [Candidatus Gottesmanbacteria bacterium]|nr:DNA-protecting protein DprA [Candidatus Gottesmanbacteria bacterium]
MDADLPFFVGFSEFPGIGPMRFRLLYEYFGSAMAAWKASAMELTHIGLGSTLTEEFHAFRSTTDPEKSLDNLTRHHVAAVAITDIRYPKLLKQITDAPFVLYVKGKRGETPINLSRTVGVVGARKVSGYGAEVTERIAGGLAQSGCTVVSGMAYGVDAIAHASALDAGGSTVAVLGCGVDIIAPAGNSRLYRDIIESGRGAVVSEMPLGFRPSRGLFPARNRIISGLSLGIVVTEGAQDSGSLITARYAAEQGREVFAVPGAITNPNSRGPAKLIKNGATLIESAADILSEIGLSGNTEKPEKTHPTLSNGEQCIYNYLSNGRGHIDDIIRGTGLTAPEAAGILTVLEIKGLVKDYGEKLFGLV